MESFTNGVTRCFTGKVVLEVATEVQAQVQNNLSVSAASDGPTVVARLESDNEGLQVETAEARLKEHGPNVLSYKSTEYRRCMRLIRLRDRGARNSL